MKNLLTLLLPALCFFFFSCGKEKVVEWPSLTELDELSITLEQASHQHEHGDQKKLLGEAKELISAVVKSTPANAKNTEQVSVLLGDLEDLGKQFTGLEEMACADLDALCKSVHPLVAKIMETSGVPHVHASADGHDPATCTDPTHNH